MTMPKFEPVAFVQSDPDGHLHLTEITKTEACQNLDQWDKQVGWKAVPLHTEDQLSEAYEAGKREASEDIEQAAFEKWLYDKCPPGDVESVQRQWLESYEYAELAGKRDAIPEGWVLVPKEPTAKMIFASWQMSGVTIPMGPNYERERISIAYHAMLAAAPKGLK